MCLALFDPYAPMTIMASVKPLIVRLRRKALLMRGPSRRRASTYRTRVPLKALQRYLVPDLPQQTNQPSSRPLLT
jgi:hypothetical protein